MMKVYNILMVVFILSLLLLGQYTPAGLAYVFLVVSCFIYNYYQQRKYDTRAIDYYEQKAKEWQTKKVQ